MTDPQFSDIAGQNSASVCVGIATRGRPRQLEAMLDHLAIQTLAPNSILVCCTEPPDVEAVAFSPKVKVLYERPGLPSQRNKIIDNLPAQTDWIVFFDDDFYPDRHWLQRVSDCFTKNPDIVCITGDVIADGILGQGLTNDEALEILASHEQSTSHWIEENASPYGCNMAFRNSAIHGLRFDERLVLYGWLEDRDFGSTVSKRGGRKVKIGRAFGVHLGTKGGRVSGRKFGYSQVINPIYLYRKRTMTIKQAIEQIARNVIANIALSLYPEPFIDRRGRLIGNLIAAVDLLRLRIKPERAASL